MQGPSQASQSQLSWCNCHAQHEAVLTSSSPQVCSCCIWTTYRTHSLRPVPVPLPQHVTPEGLVQLLRHCPKLRILKYACRAGGEGLSTQSMQRLAAVLPAVQELDFSLHPQLDASCLAALGQCKTLRKVNVACGLAAWLTAPAQSNCVSALEYAGMSSYQLIVACAHAELHMCRTAHAMMDPLEARPHPA